jgi:hypothetical protein
VAVSLVAVAVPARGSDHADPVGLPRESNLTDLFFFARGDQFVLIFDVRPSSTAPLPYDLEDKTYTVHFDFDSPLTFDNAADRARYGGTIANPGGITAEASIAIRLNDDGSLRERSITGLTGVEGIRVWAGVRDDPFIFPPFFKKNVVAMVASIPRTSFPVGQQDFVLWATTMRGGEQIDHVGRSIRTQLPRYATTDINQLAPKDQVPLILDTTRSRNKVASFLMKYRETAGAIPLWQSTLQMKAFDPVPDVMVFTTRFPGGYPNGRLLTDDVVLQTCLAGDCLLVDLSTSNGVWPRATTNDKPFLPDFPYLADPWPNAAEPPSGKSIIPLVIFIVMLLLLVLSVIPFWIGYKLGRRRRAAATA